MKLLASALSRWGLEPGDSLTSAKLQIFSGRCKQGHGWELGGSWCPLTDIFFTKRSAKRDTLLITFMVF